MARTVSAKQKLREAAEQMISHRQDLILADDEVSDEPTAINIITGGDKSGDIYGAVIDKKSDEGYVQLFQCGLLATGANEEGYEYEHVDIPNERGFVIYGASVILYVYRR